MDKHLVTIEFRYSDKPNDNGFGVYKTRTVTIGVYDTLEEAVEEGNKSLEILNRNGIQMRDEDAFKMRGLFGLPNRLVSNCCYPTNGIQFFAEITPLVFNDLSDTIKEAFNAFDRWKEFKTKEDYE